MPEPSAQRILEPRSVKALLALGERVLSDSSHLFADHDHALEARELLAACLDLDPDDLPENEVLDRRIRDRYLAMVTRRAGGEPLPWLTGYIEFYGLELEVRPGPFVPRPSSELTVSRAARKLRRRRSPIVVDVCTGAGPIAIAIADEFPEAEVWGADIDSEGLRQARRNARALDVTNARFLKSNMYDQLPKRLAGNVDVITGHVPYVPLDEVEDLPTEVREFEPIFTLSDQASGDGLDLMRRAIGESVRWLKPGGWLLLEVSEDLGTRMRRIMRRAGLADRGIASDEDGLSVVVEGVKP
jgi:release factor glutamine methyltransferase